MCHFVTGQQLEIVFFFLALVLVGWLVGWLVSGWVCWLAGWLAGWLAASPTSPTSLGPGVAYWL